MNRRLLLLGSAAVWASSQAACYFLVDTSGIVGGPEVAVDGSPGPAVDAGFEAGADDDAGLLAYWSFDEQTNGIVEDLSGHHHDGQLGTPSLLSPGKTGQALASAMTVESLSGDRFPRQGTLSFWLRADFSGSQNSGLYIFDHYEPSRSHLFVRVPNDSTLYLQMACQTAGQAQYPFEADLSNPASNTWTHLVFAWDSVAHTAAVYINGKLQAKADQGELASWTPSEQQFSFASSFPKGLIDEARVYARALSAAEVNAIP